MSTGKNRFIYYDRDGEEVWSGYASRYDLQLEDQGPYLALEAWECGGAGMEHVTEIISLASNPG
jgi:hypothetical protein